MKDFEEVPKVIAAAKELTFVSSAAQKPLNMDAIFPSTVIASKEPSPESPKLR